ncbi:(2Fe-2S)-binding protein [Halovulum dunhuangense]|uniref:(2Fe-2S)-binding protein n=1 Tax=Halovulum dunhuangense TaxID=1505036 RepID=UPI0031B5CF77
MKLKINGREHEIDADPDTPLAYVLREDLGLKGTKIGCGLEQCGACAVLVDGRVELSCTSPAASFEGREIVTVEGLADTDTGARVQRAFVAAGAAQCGYCTSGLVVAVTALLDGGGKPDRARTAAALTPHLCRCGSHPRVFAAVEMAAEGEA